MIALFDDPGHGGRMNIEDAAAMDQAFAAKEIGNEMIGNGGDLIACERVKRDDAIDAVEEFWPEKCTCGFDEGVMTRGLCGAEAKGCGGLARAEIGCHDDDGAGEIGCSAQRIRQAAFA